MPEARSWEAERSVTPRNAWARLYFDPGRSRLMLHDGFVDFSNMWDRAYAMAWCKTNGVGFFDHRPSLLPEGLRCQIRTARAAGSGEQRELKSLWRLVPLGLGAVLSIPQLNHIPSWRDARANRPPPALVEFPPPRYWNGTHHHAFTCACYVCHHARAARPTTVV